MITTRQEVGRRVSCRVTRCHPFPHLHPQVLAFLPFFYWFPRRGNSTRNSNCLFLARNSRSAQWRRPRKKGKRKEVYKKALPLYYYWSATHAQKRWGRGRRRENFSSSQSSSSGVKIRIADLIRVFFHVRVFIFLVRYISSRIGVAIDYRNHLKGGGELNSSWFNSGLWRRMGGKTGCGGRKFGCVVSTGRRHHLPTPPQPKRKTSFPSLLPLPCQLGASHTHTQTVIYNSLPSSVCFLLFPPSPGPSPPSIVNSFPFSSSSPPPSSPSLVYI